MRKFLKFFFQLCCDFALFMTFSWLAFKDMEAIVDGRSLWFVCLAIISSWGGLFSSWMMYTHIHAYRWKRKQQRKKVGRLVRRIKHSQK